MHKIPYAKTRKKVSFKGADYKKEWSPRRQHFVSQAKSGVETQLKNMSIILFLGQNLKDYIKNSKTIIEERLKSETMGCDCLRPLKRHSSYKRKIKETGEKITIVVVWCRACKKWHALLPDFLLQGKHYSGNEIESVIIDSETAPVSQIETEASESTVRRWIKQINERIKQANGKLKYHFGKEGKAICETAINIGSVYSELEQVLEMAPSTIKCSGNKLGLANLWLGTNAVKAYI
jgi:hypothetical protein